MGLYYFKKFDFECYKNISNKSTPVCKTTTYCKVDTHVSRNTCKIHENLFLNVRTVKYIRYIIC